MDTYKGIMRPATEVEKQDFIEIGTKTPMDDFFSKVTKMHQKYLKQRKPYCMACARLDFEDKIGEYTKETTRAQEGFNEKLKSLELPEIEQYADSDRFEIVGEQEVIETKLLDGIKQEVLTGKYIRYRCKARGHGISMFIPLTKTQDGDYVEVPIAELVKAKKKVVAEKSDDKQKEKTAKK